MSASSHLAPPMDRVTVGRNTFGGPLNTLTRQNLEQKQLRQQLAAIDVELKDWFLTRRVCLERNISLKKLFDRYNFTGLSMNNSEVPDVQRILWNDLVLGKPELEDELKVDAREMKADMYTRMFKNATDLENPCRIPGVTYLRCLQENVEDNEEMRSKKCMESFSSFVACRDSLLRQNSAAISNSLLRQHQEDLHAKSLFLKRCELLDRVTGV
ncbi:putative myosin heavy chain [Cardiosporidium cionae]|uniref:Myosin heavy chain n=1 Tax=Cardiosporidium cionae TaxID=476202 RepID=A0ABQ7J916_9APIC|nr:putative myosin heavy chain [Cardiosporidium cionae]|eukprot:KAF8820424.1 putative myosin heavy chain [Cardiosporidium cionae]